MRRSISSLSGILLATALALSLGGCYVENEPEPVDEPAEQPEPEPETQPAADAGASSRNQGLGKSKESVKNAIDDLENRDLDIDDE